jgi:hypothetical protein
MDFQVISDYFESLADKHTDINSFHNLGPTDALGAAGGGIDYPALVMEKIDGGLSDDNAERVRDHVTVAFMILDKFEIGNHTEEYDLLKRTKEIGLDIVKRIYHENRDKLYNARDIKEFNLNTVRYWPTMLLFEGGKGYYFELKIAEAFADFTIDNAKWSDL